MEEVTGVLFTNGTSVQAITTAGVTWIGAQLILTDQEVVIMGNIFNAVGVFAARYWIANWTLSYTFQYSSS